MRRIWMAVRAASVILVFAGGCAMIAGLDHEYEQESAAPSGGGGSGGGGGGEDGLPCMTSDDCPINTDCATWACTEGACVVTVVPDGTPVTTGAVQGDCKKNVCQGGKPAVLNDDADVPVDNIGDCVLPACSDGTLSSIPVMKGADCTVKPSGKCCGTNCCANAEPNPATYCDNNNQCCATKICNGVCCMNAAASCHQNACCETANVCNNVCCQTTHACETGSNNCCPVSQRCPNGTCCSGGQTCNASNLCS